MNYLAVLVAAIANMVLGFLWYSPMLFGNLWMKLMGLTMEKINAQKKQMNQTYMVSFLGAIVMAFVLSKLMGMTGASGSMNGVIMLGFWVWLGFVAPVQLTDVLFGQRPIKLYLINTGYQLVGLLIMGAILGSWS